MQMLMRSSSQLHQHGLGGFRAVHDAVLLLHFYFQGDAQTDMHEVSYVDPEYHRLSCQLLLVHFPCDLLIAWRSLIRFFMDRVIFPDGRMKAKYAMEITDILRHLSFEARRGVEKCLLNVLSGIQGGKLRFSAGDRWTPDSLLSSMHGE
ncbi:hypothetical protein V1509DRAFT_634671 [Lipomyces kononenkoae]